MTRILLSLILFLLAACSSNQIRNEVAPPVSASPESQGSAELNIDYESLHRALGLERPTEKLGFVEKPFPTCGAGYGYSPTHNCRTDYFVSIHFQLLCRDSVGTLNTALEKHEMFPLADRQIKWTMKDTVGNVKLDGQGFGQIKMAFRKSQHHQRLKLNAGNDFLYLRANEITRIVTPKEWCN